MLRTPVLPLSLSLVLLASIGCASSSTNGTLDGGSTPGADSGTHDATTDTASIIIIASDTGTPSVDTGAPSADSGTTADAVADVATDVVTGDATPSTDGSTPVDAGTTTTDASSTAPTTCAAAHGNIGCCVNATTISYCGGDGGETLKTETCTGTKVCAWDTTGGYYHCGAADAGPSPNEPAACGPLDAGTTPTTDAGTTATDAGAVKDSGTTTTDAGTSGGDAAVPTTCAEANGEYGCCSGQTLYYCLGSGTPIARPCIDGNVCGWATGFGYYDCGPLSGKAPGDDPPKACK